MHRRLFFALTLLGWGTAPWAAQTAPALMLARVCPPGTPVTDFWVSEKFDGVRGYWTGKQLLTRGGEVIPAPVWFTHNWPDQVFEGELWAGSGRFAEAMSTVRQLKADDAAWRGIRFMVFDMPAMAAPFTSRIAAYQALVEQLGQPWVVATEQVRVATPAALQTRLTAIEQAGGEGLMLHRADAHYVAGRSDTVLKVKSSDDAEAKVVAHVPGKGKHAGQLGALWMETPEGIRFKLGTGFSDAQRRNPPAVGSWVTYRYQGTHTRSGAPRFASFLRLAAP